ncbi:DUF2785 domain-containing protein [Metamycoplasma neophronis]|uniref:DUF2785 domain-containing protein n=1 Tax=Metamycoplasma neophronis TaxID=872983 RepID=A0ABY2Z0R8_9BACT|nr:DUF2785 domain-containing protein [Metamycoplasma neophronis]TPR54753.1 DUF2785 domain-containing protein [Metamycoplasma neophronis]
MIKQLEKKLNTDEDIEINQDELNFMLQNIGSPDKQIRDEIIFSLFGKGFYTEAFEKEQVIEIYDYLINQNIIFEKIEEADILYALKRSFAILLYSLIVTFGNKKEYKYFGILSKGQTHKILEEILKYIEKEKCTVGYSEQYGWIDCFSHASQLIIDLIKADYEHSIFPNQILDSIYLSLINQNSEFGDGQEKRFAYIIASLYKNGYIEHDEILEYIKKLGSYQREAKSFDIKNERCYENILNTLNFFVLFINDGEIINLIKNLNNINEIISMI